MKCLFTSVHQFYLSLGKLPKTKIHFYWDYCTTEFVHLCLATTSLARTRNFFQNKLHILKLLIITFISMLDMQYWKCNNIWYTQKIEEKLKILILLHYYCKILTPRTITPFPIILHKIFNVHPILEGVQAMLGKRDFLVLFVERV